MDFMQRRKVCDVFPDFGTMDVTAGEREFLYSTADILWFYQPLGPTPRLLAKRSADDPGYWTSDTEWNCRPSMVIDTDDDIFNVLPLNPAFAKMGTRVNEQELPDGAEISIQDADGKIHKLYKDGEEINGEVPFDLKANRLNLENYRKNLEAAALVTCSTPRSAAYVLREVPGANTFVHPNCFNLADYPAVELAKKQTVRMLWQGGSNHHDDLIPYRPVLKRLMDAYPHLELVIWGGNFKMPEMPAERFTFLPWTPYEEYKLRLCTINHDIAIAPLNPATFNQSRSAIKAQESAVCASHAAALCQRTGAYQDEVIEGETGMLFDDPEEFFAKASQLIESEALRKQLAANMVDWVRENRDPGVWAEKLANAFATIRTGRKAVTPVPPKPQELVVEHALPA